MDKQLAQELLKVFDTPYTVEIFNLYLDTEIKRAFSALKGVTDPAGIYRLQGQIAAYELMKKVRENSLSIVKGS